MEQEQEVEVEVSQTLRGNRNAEEEQRSAEEKRLREEELIIELGRKEAQREYEEKRRKQCQVEAEEAPEKDHLKTIKKINETEHSQSQSKPTGRPCVIHRNGATEVGKKDDLVNEVAEKENAQFEQVLKSNGISKVATDITIEDEICFENIKPMEIFKELEGPQNMRVLNKSLQKQKLANEDKIFRQETRPPTKSFSLSR